MFGRSRRGGQRRRTVPVNGRLLLVVRNPASADRIADLCPIVRGHHGIGVKATVEPGSAFGRQVGMQLEILGIELVPWAAVRDRDYDVVIAAHASSQLARFQQDKIILVPHGAGYNRKVWANTHSCTSPVGLSRRELMTWYRRLIPGVVGLSGEEQRHRLHRSCRKAVSHAVVVGDPTYDRLVQCRPLRKRYRRALGVGADQILVFVTSTWGEHSLLHHHTDLVDRLMAQLPVDRFKVVMAQHPNVWAWHSEFDLCAELDNAMAAGLMVLRAPSGHWRGALLAADVVIGDHGSVSFYGAALGLPVFAVGTGKAELVPDSPMHDYLDRAYPLDVDGDLRAQLERAVDERDPGRFADIVERMVGGRRDGLDRLRTILFDRLGLRVPKEKINVRPPDDPVPIPSDPPRAFTARARLTWRPGRVDVDVERFPVVDGVAHPEPVEDRVLMIEANEIDVRRRLLADIVVEADRLDSATDAVVWVRQTLSTLIGAHVAAAAHPGGVLVLLRRKGLVDVTVLDGRQSGCVERTAFMATMAVRQLVVEWEGAAIEPEIDVHVTMAPFSAVFRVRSRPD